MIGMIPADISYSTSCNGKNKIRTIIRKKHKMRSLIKWNPISDFHDVTNQLSHLMNFGQRPTIMMKGASTILLNGFLQ